MTEMRDVQRLKKYKILGCFESCTAKYDTNVKWNAVDVLSKFFPAFAALRAAKLLEAAELPDDMDEIYSEFAHVFGNHLDGRLPRFVSVHHCKELKQYVFIHQVVV